nr:hypothetical protein [Abalone asfa-like virus]
MGQKLTKFNYLFQNIIQKKITELRIYSLPFQSPTSRAICRLEYLEFLKLNTTKSPFQLDFVFDIRQFLDHNDGYLKTPKIIVKNKKIFIGTQDTSPSNDVTFEGCYYQIFEK